MKLGVDIGGTAIKAGLVDSKGKIHKRQKILTQAHQKKEEIVRRIIDLIQSYDLKDFSKLGIGVPGVVSANGSISFSPNTPLAKSNISKKIRLAIKKPVVFGNDADNAARASHAFGKAKGYKNVVCLTLGTGIGSALILNNNLYTQGAPEFGHTTIKYDAKKVTRYPNAGCVESFIGSHCFSSDPLEVAQKAKRGNAQAKKEFDRYGFFLGIGIANIINMLNPQIIVLQGEISRSVSLFKEAMQKEVKKRALFRVKIVRETLVDSGVIGATLL